MSGVDLGYSGMFDGGVLSIDLLGVYCLKHHAALKASYLHNLLSWMTHCSCSTDAMPSCLSSLSIF